ncbi:MAG: hydroxymethylglutaryl-CoA reductase, degradative, partial [Myxococcales bacterium]|nr:hydroxymethylglutaryl-CoA reductase, degradative [Myxococcales bacterium]
MSHSQISGFYRLDVPSRRAHIAELMGLSQDDLRILSGEDGLSEAHADRMVENALGVMGLPLGLCVNMHINGEDFLVPMAVEEPSVVAACSFAAKLIREGGGITATVSEPVMIGQIQVMDVPDVAAAEAALLGAKDSLLALANSGHPHLMKAGGGAVDLELNRLPKVDPADPLGDMLVAHLVVDVRDAMGANAINSMCERLAPRVAELTGGRVGLRILSNLTDRRTVTVVGKVPFSALEGRGKGTGEDLARAIEEASVFAERCPYRATTHNKGIMNGIDSVLLAFGQDWRAVEAGAHAYAARDGRYTALAQWRVEDGHLVGRMTVPMAVGTVGGVFKVHPTVQVACKVAGVHTTPQLAAVVAAAGLAQNLAAIRALAAEGIQSGHMRLHARNVAAEAGAEGDEVHKVAEHIADLGKVNIDAARLALEQLRTHNAVIESPVDELDVKARFEHLGAAFLPQIVDLTAQVMRASPGGDGTLPDMCLYHYQTGGKRLRALLPLLTAEAMGEAADKMVPFGAACEMLHNATLVHDDLQDGDEVRRGMPTVWKRYGMPQAVNLGDAMFYYTLLLEQQMDVPVARRERAAKRILQETLRVIDGQEREFGLKETKDLTLEAYFKMVEGKTSGLFALPMAGAAEVLGASHDVVEGLAEAARHMGVLFQIQDDVLDLYGEKGRDMRGSDIAEGKRSALVVHALEHATPEDRAWLVELLDRPRAETTEADVYQVIALFERTGSLDFTLDEMRRRRAAALEVPALLSQPRLLELVAGFSDLFLAPIQFLMEDPRGVVAGLLAQGAPTEAGVRPEDHAFCFEMLPKVSRTFALSIGALPESLR